jgi:hypothetical protein
MRYEMSTRVALYILIGMLLYGILSMFDGNLLREAQAKVAIADAASSTALRLSGAVKRSGERTAFVSDSMQAVVDSAVAEADEASQRAKEREERVDSLSAIVTVGRVAVRAILLPYQLAPFDGLMDRISERHEELQIANAELAAEVFSVRQALRTMTRDRDQQALQVERYRMANGSLEEALGKSRHATAAAMRAANRGFLRDLWGDLPELIVAFISGVAADRVLFVPP